MTKYIAKPYISGSPNTEITGLVMTSFLDNVEAETLRPVLEKYGLTQPDVETWYPYQTWLNVLRDLQELFGSSNTFIAIGRKAVEKIALPTEINSIPGVLPLLQAIYDFNIRNAAEGEGYHIVQKGERHYWEYQNTPNPDDLIYGYIWGLVARFKQPDEHFVVRMLPNPHPELHPGTIFEVKWGPKNAKLD